MSFNLHWHLIDPESMPPPLVTATTTIVHTLGVQLPAVAIRNRMKYLSTEPTRTWPNRLGHNWICQTAPNFPVRTSRSVRCWPVGPFPMKYMVMKTHPLDNNMPGTSGRESTWECFRLQMQSLGVQSNSWHCIPGWYSGQSPPSGSCPVVRVGLSWLYLINRDNKLLINATDRYCCCCFAKGGRPHEFKRVYLN